MNQFEEFFSANKDFTFVHGVYRLEGFVGEEFESEYTAIRKKEKRIYTDDIVRSLPSVPITHPHFEEWKLREYTSRHFSEYLKENGCKSFIEVGCGNGWVTTLIQNYLGVPACGIDVGHVELEQAARISEGKSVFAYGDIFSDKFDGLKADAIILASCVQYFPDVRKLLMRLRKMGTVYIIDSPIYKKGKAAAATARTRGYFRSMHAPGMEKFYHHHERSAFEEFNPEYLYDPTRGAWWLVGLLVKISPFPWIKIGKGDI